MPLLWLSGPLYRPPYIARHLPSQKSPRNLGVTSGRLYTSSLSFNMYNLPRVCESVVLVVQTWTAAVRNLASRLKRVAHNTHLPTTYSFVSLATVTTSPCFKEVGVFSQISLRKLSSCCTYSFLQSSVMGEDKFFLHWSNIAAGL